MRSRQACEKVGDEARFDPLGVADPWGETLHQPAVALSETHVIGADVAADPQEPRQHSSITSERSDRADSAQVGLLNQVLDIAIGTQRVAQLPHVGLGQGDELRDGRIITLDRSRDHFAKDSVGRHHSMVPDCGLG